MAQKFDQIEIQEDLNQLIIKERNKELKQIEQDTSDLAESMQILRNELNKQGDKIDLISANTESSSDASEKGTKDLQKAENHANNSRIWKAILISGSVLGIAGATAITLLKR